MEDTVFVIGGCRSGKSAYALQAAEKIPGDRKVFIATCVPQDEEMATRVAKHQKERSQDWTTVEEPLHLSEAIEANSPQADVLLVDCLTLWMSNLLLKIGDEKQIKESIHRFIDSLENAPHPIVLVSNEVGTGIVPENKLARQYRDLVGSLNQAAAQTADKVVWMVAGIPVIIKPPG